MPFTILSQTTFIPRQSHHTNIYYHFFLIRGFLKKAWGHKTAVIPCSSAFILIRLSIVFLIFRWFRWLRWFKSTFSVHWTCNWNSYKVVWQFGFTVLPFVLSPPSLPSTTFTTYALALACTNTNKMLVVAFPMIPPFYFRHKMQNINLKVKMVCDNLVKVEIKFTYLN